MNNKRHTMITYADGAAIQHMYYLPFGETLEKDEETGYSYFGARYYNSDLSVWLSVDPMSDKYPSLSPYAYCANNPVILVDPDGKDISPIYDRDGWFLGTDDQGLQGEAIIMNNKDFRQGMPHQEALSKRTTINSDRPLEAEMRWYGHYLTLKDRPDWDGYVTREEGIAWAKTHPNAIQYPTPDNILYLNASKLDFGTITIADFKNGIGKSSPIQLLTKSNSRLAILERQANQTKLFNTIYALGRVDIVLLNNKGMVRIVNNNATDYDWNFGGGIIREVLIRAERNLNNLNDSDGFKVYYYGIGKLH